MSEMLDQLLPEELRSVYAKLSQQDVEQFYAGYQLWQVQQQIAALQEQISALQQQIAENAEQMQKIHPSALALAVLARLSASGVTDVDLLDRMLERGEEWLDGTLQHLDYCEQIDVIGGNYAEWCEHALEGAYDWIDSMQDVSTGSTSTVSSPPVASNSGEALVEATEELLLQKLTTEEEEYLSLEPTLKRPAIVLPPREEPVLPTEEAVTLEEIDAPPETLASNQEVTVADTASQSLIEQEVVEEEQLLAVPLPATEEQVPMEVSDAADIVQPIIEQVEQEEQEEVVSVPEEVIVAEQVAWEEQEEMVPPPEWVTLVEQTIGEEQEQAVGEEQEEVTPAPEEIILDEQVAWEEQGELIPPVGEVVLWEVETAEDFSNLAVKQDLQQAREGLTPETGEPVHIDVITGIVSGNNAIHFPFEQVSQQDQTAIPSSEEATLPIMDELPAQQETLLELTSLPARRRRWWAWWRR